MQRPDWYDDFGAFYRQWKRYVTVVVRSRLIPTAVVDFEDVVQDVFLSLWVGWKNDRIRPSPEIIEWHVQKLLITVTWHSVVHARRKADLRRLPDGGYTRRTFSMDDVLEKDRRSAEWAESRIDTTKSYGQMLAVADMAQHVPQALEVDEWLAELPDREHLVVLLRLDGYTEPEIGEMTGDSVSTVDQLYRTALCRILGRIEE